VTRSHFFDPAKSLEAGTHHLADLYRAEGNALAAVMLYNYGYDELARQTHGDFPPGAVWYAAAVLDRALALRSAARRLH